MTKPKLTSPWVAIIAWLGCGASTVFFPVSVMAVEAGTVYLISHSPAEDEAPTRNVLVLDNHLLDRVFGEYRSAEKGRDEKGNVDAGLTLKLPAGAAPSPILPNGSLLTGITRNIAPRRAAALRLAEKGRVLLQSGDYRRALYPLEKALGLDANPIIYFYLARTHYYLGNDDRASGFLAAAEAGFVPDASWTGELVALRTAISSRPLVQQEALKQSVRWASRY